MLFSLVLVHLALLESSYFFPLQGLIEMFPVTQEFAMLFSVLMFAPFWVGIVLERKKLDSKTWMGLGLVGVLSYLYEWVSINFGFPYGRFEYTEMMGGLKIFGDVPLVLPMIYVPMVFGMLYVFKFLKRWHRVLAVGVGLMLFDVAIDPGITASGIWIWGEALLPGRLYDVPVQNFLGWFLTGCLSAFVLLEFVDEDFWNSLSDKFGWVWISPISFSLAYWIGVALREGYWVSILIGFVMGLVVFLNFKKS